MYSCDEIESLAVRATWLLPKASGLSATCGVFLDANDIQLLTAANSSAVILWSHDDHGYMTVSVLLSMICERKKLAPVSSKSRLPSKTPTSLSAFQTNDPDFMLYHTSRLRVEIVLRRHDYVMDQT